MLRIRRLIFNGLNCRNARDAGILALLCIAVPLVVLWLPIAKSPIRPGEDFVWKIIGLAMTLLMAWTAGGGFTRKLEDNLSMLAGFLAVFAGAMVYQKFGIPMLYATIGLTVLGWFLVMRSLANFITRNRARDMLIRMHRSSWGLPV